MGTTGARFRCTRADSANGRAQRAACLDQNNRAMAREKARRSHISKKGATDLRGRRGGHSFYLELVDDTLAQVLERLDVLVLHRACSCQCCKKTTKQTREPEVLWEGRLPRMPTLFCRERGPPKDRCHVLLSCRSSQSLDEKPDRSHWAYS